MPPKKKQQENKPKKVAEDRTFGLKNKRGAKGQQMVALVAQQQKAAEQSRKDKDKEKTKNELAKKKADEAKRKEELAELFKPVTVQQKVPFGVDPKSVLCINFKNGACERGTKCKFSHDLDVNRKSEKKDVYTDARREDTMDKWDDAKLQEVVLSKSGNAVTTTDIVCKFFIEAIEKQTFGWFWECPNGVDCKYKHALPPGFVLKSMKKKEEEDASKQVISLEDYIENQRHRLPAKLTPVTPETFATWKKTRMDKKEAAAEAIKKAKETQAAAGKATGMSGRDLFSYNPLFFEEEGDEADDEDWDLAQYRRKTEAEREVTERMRIEALGGTVDSLNLDDVDEDDEDESDEDDEAESSEEEGEEPPDSK